MSPNCAGCYLYWWLYVRNDVRHLGVANDVSLGQPPVLNDTAATTGLICLGPGTNGMISVGDEAPEFTAPLANGEVADITLSDAVADGPVVLAFFPGAFTSVCGTELESFDDRLAEFADAGVTVYGVSIDTPFAQNAFREELGLSFALISDSNREIIGAYDIAMDFTALGVHDLAKRAVFVVDEDRTVTYAWVSDDPGVEPDYEAVVAAARDA